MATRYFTTPIYYVNAEPHIGHLYTTVLADTLKRFHRLMGDDAYFLTGTDEHGEKIAESAAKRGETPQAQVDRVSGIFRATWDAIGVGYDDFIRTTEPRHKRYVQQVLQQVKDAGDIYFGEYTGLYCVGCERRLDLSELVDGLCPDHKTAPKEVKEANYFFRMSRYQEALVAHLEQHPDWIRPERFRNEVLSFLRQPLEDLCISRPKTRLTWGIDLPFDDRFVTYVWFDALLNYLSALHETSAGLDVAARYWPACNHLIAKDILKTHAIYWPTMLLAAGLPLPARLDVHGYWLSGDSKMSKSLGNVVRPLSFDQRFGIENLRYFFFREMKFGADSSFTYELFVERYNADLANGLGNLLSRCASIVRKSLGGALPPLAEGVDDAAQAVLAKAVAVTGTYAELFESRQFHLAIEGVRQLLAEADKYINDAQPWRLAKEPARQDELARVLGVGLEVVRVAAVLLSPVMPNKCAEILAFLGDPRPLDGTVPLSRLVALGSVPGGFRLQESVPTFPRIDEKRLSEVLAEAEREQTAASGPAAVPLRSDLKPAKPEITIEEFDRIDLRVGVIRKAEHIEGAKKLLRLEIDLGEGRLRQIFAGIRSAYEDPSGLVGKQVTVVANLRPRQMKWGLSEGMVCAGGGGTERLCVTTFDRELLPGDPVS